MIPEIYKDIGLRIRKLREETGLSQEELGRRLGKRTQGSIAQLEQGLRKIDIETLLQLTQTFAVTLDYFLTEGWKVSRQKNQPVLIIDGLDLSMAFDQYLEETPFEDLRTTEEVRLKVLARPEQVPRAMAEFAENDKLFYTYRPTPREWLQMTSKTAHRRGAYRSIADVIHTLETLRDSGVLE